MKRTISIAKGKGSIGHNNRDFKAENVDADRVHLNTCFVNEDLKKVYHKLFDEALENYNNKQKRNDRKIPDYYEKIRTSKQEKLSYEIIVQVGDFEDMNAKSDNGKLAEEILKKYMADFQKRNPTLYVFSAHLHMDEATPHLHIDFVPYTSGNKRGLETKNTLKGALNQLGFNGGTKSSTELNQWQDTEKEVVAKIMLEHGIEWEKKGTQKKHLSVENYKAEKRAEEVLKLDKVIEEKSTVIENLDLKNEEITGEISEKQEDLELLSDEFDSKSKKLKKVENHLDTMLKDVKTIDNNIHKFDEDKEWQLPDPPVLITANAYKDKKAAPLVSALKEYIKGLTIKFVRLKSEFDKQARLIQNLTNRLERAEERAIKNDRYNILEKILGKDKIDDLISDYQNNTKKPIIQMKKQNHER
ncbi:plasmid recombination protein [Chakrabartyella piscis]|uniref:plasmid recombination protein n=1 Tax=Chakrabartyella piscis TaxID=2918914 RepID=UPI002958739E|nr:plasmid recombination protein [Chakrabartyella piscis]